MLCLLLLGAFCSMASSANILAIMPTPMFSHQVTARPIWKELSKRGHQVTLITPNPILDPNLTNLTEIDVSFLYDYMKKTNFHNELHKKSGDMFETVEFASKLMVNCADLVLSHPPVKKLINDPNSKFDLMLIESVMVSYFPIAQKFNVPLIEVSSMDLSTHYCYGNDVNPITNPDKNIPYIRNLTLLQRFISTSFSYLSKYLFKNYFIYVDELIEKHYGSGFPSARKLMCLPDMAFINVNPVLDNPRAMSPAVINVGGGFHLQPPKKLPQDLQEYLDNSKQGVIYFSLGGTNIQSKNLPENTLRVLKETFSEIPYNVLWKYEDDDMLNKPKNVKTVKWAPQQDILNHPNVKLFITQGGLQSLEEAIFSGVPLLGMPFFGDQHGNVNKLVFHKIGLKADKDNLKKETLKANILEVITNPVYKKNIIRVAELSKDQPMSGVEKAVWWTEYVLRHKDVSHLRGLAPTIPFYQYYLLDVFAIYAAVILIILLIIYLVFKSIFFVLRKILKLKIKKEKTN